MATSDPRASEAGAEVLRQGGNAVDAAVTAAFVLLVVEPHACGVGGDAFVLLKERGAPPVALDGSGAVPAALAAVASRDDFQPVPIYGPRTFTVPGALDLFERVLARHGTITLEAASERARHLARDGFTVRPTLAAASEGAMPLLTRDPVLGPLYVPKGRQVQVGQTVRNERLATALDVLAARGARDLYEGGLGRAIAERARVVGGYLDAVDLSAHRTVPMTPVSTPFAGADVWELPEPTQGPAVLESLRLLDAWGRFDTDSVIRALLQGLKSAGIDLLKMGNASVHRGDTTYIAAIDGKGDAVSLITSIFSPFGSCVGVEAIGGPLQNRAGGIALVGQRPRRGKPPHTTIPALVTRLGELTHVLGVVGGYMQAQGQVQVLLNLIVHRMAPQAAIAAPRFRILAGGELAVEPDHELVKRMPEAVLRDPGVGGFGGCQVASRVDGVVDGASDRRRGGTAVFV